MLVVDDVITAGTAIREAMDILYEAEAVPAGVVIALDRQVYLEVLLPHPRPTPSNPPICPSTK